MKRATKISIIAMIAAFGAVTLPAASQSKKQYTLDECVSEAVSNNLKLRNANGQVAMSEEQRKEALTKYFPTITASGAAFTANKSLIQVNLMGMDMAFVKKGVVAGVQAMQPVFKGGLIINNNRLAKVGEEASRLQRDLTENEIRLGVEQYYWQIVMLEEKLVTLNLLDKQLESVRNDAQVAVDAGIRNRNDLLQVQLRQNEVRTSIIQAQNAISTGKDLLAQLMGHANEEFDVSSQFGLGEDEAPMPESPEALYQSPETSLAQTYEYQLLDKNIEANKLQHKLSVGNNLPTVAVGGAYQYDNILDKSQNHLIGMVSVIVPLTNWWGGSHEMKRMKIQTANSLNEKQEQSEMLVIRMRKAWNDMTDAYEQVAIAKESIAQSEENLRLNTDYYQAGTATISDLLDAQTLYQKSKDKYVESYTLYEIKKREYLLVTGRR